METKTYRSRRIALDPGTVKALEEQRTRMENRAEICEVGLETVRLHDLRHYVATRLLDGGVPVRAVSERLGHATATTTLAIYAHAVPATDRRAALRRTGAARPPGHFIC
jgi:integrase